VGGCRSHEEGALEPASVRKLPLAMTHTHTHTQECKHQTHYWLISYSQLAAWPTEVRIQRRQNSCIPCKNARVQQHSSPVKRLEGPDARCELELSRTCNLTTLRLAHRAHTLKKKGQTRTFANQTATHLSSSCHHRHPALLAPPPPPLPLPLPHHPTIAAAAAAVDAAAAPLASSALAPASAPAAAAAAAAEASAAA